MSERASWLELPEEELPGLCSQLKTFVAKAVAKGRAWWRDTTDVVVLNSPWLRRGTGRIFRCVCVLVQSSMLVREMFVSHDFLGFAERSLMLTHFALLSAMTICFGATLWISCRTQRESFRATLLFAVGVVINFGLLLEIKRQFWEAAIYFLAFVVMCHCNVHPTVLLLPIFYQMKVFFWDWNVLQDDISVRAPYAPLWLQVLMSELMLLLAFACDFSRRVKAVCEGILFGEDGSDLLQSPVAGRSCRNLCWLPAINQWIWWSFVTIKNHMRLINEPGTEYLQNHLPVSSFAVPALAGGLVLLGVLSKRRTTQQSRFAYLTLHDWYVDFAFAFFCCGPTLLFLVNFHFAHLRRKHDVRSIRWLGWIEEMEQEALILVAASVQTLVQAGCHPLICVMAAIAMTTAALMWPELELGGTRGDEYITFRLVLSALMWCLQASHLIDFFSRMRAIQTGMQQSRQNAASSMMFLSSTSLHGLELPAIRDEEMPAPVKSPSRRPRTALVAVVRHAERADNAQSFDGWGTSKDAADFPHDPPITTRGVEQTQQLAAELIAEGMDFDVIVSSPFLRCLQTALILAEKFDATVLIDEELGEVMGPSVFESEPPLPPRKTTLQESSPSADFHTRLRAGRFMGKRPRWAETLQQARLRYVKRYLDYLRRSRRTRKSCLLVTHGHMVQACATVLPANQYRRVSSVDYCGAAVASCYKLAETNRDDEAFFPAKGDSFEAKGASFEDEQDGERKSKLLEGAKVRYWELWMRGVRTLPSPTAAVAAAGSLQSLGQSWEEIEKLLGVLPPVGPAPSVAAGSHSESVCSIRTRTSTTISMNMIREPGSVPSNPTEEEEKSKDSQEEPKQPEKPAAAPKLTLSMSRLAARRMKAMPATVEEDQVNQV